MEKEHEVMDEYQELVEKIDSNSPYHKKVSARKKWMSVPEMGALLGLKKTERYWLLHKNLFESKEIVGQLRINIESFEKWYANQVKYHKVTGEEPGKELKEWSFSIREIAELLEVNENVVYDLINREKIETVIIDYWTRVPKTAFWNWYKNQTKYQIREDREACRKLLEATISMPQMARLLGVERGVVYSILKSPKYGDIFETVMIADQKRITKESFQKFLDCQKRYQLDTANDYEELTMEENIALADFRRKKLFQTGERKSNGNLKYLTAEEAAMMAKVSRTMVIHWYQKGEFPVIYLGNRVRINRKEFESWLKKRERGEN